MESPLKFAASAPEPLTSSGEAGLLRLSTHVRHPSKYARRSSPAATRRVANTQTGARDPSGVISARCEHSAEVARGGTASTFRGKDARGDGCALWVGRATVNRLLGLHHELQSPEPRPRGGGNFCPSTVRSLSFSSRSSGRCAMRPSSNRRRLRGALGLVDEPLGRPAGADATGLLSKEECIVAL